MTTVLTISTALLRGLPLPLVRIVEVIFERLPEDEAKAFSAAIPDAVARDGKDLSRVHWQFLAVVLREIPSQPGGVQDVIDPVIAGMDLLARGQDWPEAAARAAAEAAAWAAWAEADAAAEAAAWAAWAAAEAAWAAAWAAAEAARAAARAAAWAARAAARAAADAAAEAADAGVPYARQRDLILKLISEA